MSKWMRVAHGWAGCGVSGPGLAIVLALPWLLGACAEGSDPLGGGLGGDVSVDGVSPRGEPEGAAIPEPGAEDGEPDTIPGDGLGSPTGDTGPAGGSDGAPAGGGDSDGPEAGSFGAPCAGPGDCFSGWCLPGPDGAVCSKTCEDTCPGGWSCEPMTDATGSPAFVCIAELALLCTPCTSHAQCNQLDAGENLCVGDATAGTFCGVACGPTSEATCPEGFACEDVEGAGGGATAQCLPAEGGTCSCSGLAVALQVTTPCQAVSVHGTCEGTLSCPAVGAPICDALHPEGESCNGEDDDCDGEIDEGTGGETCDIIGPLGICPGVSVCTNGSSHCVGDEATAETCDGTDDDCDGLVDEGFPDTDEDGLANCVDDDDDDDGIPDDLDCGPLEASVNPEAAEHCDDVDHDCDGHITAPGAVGCTVYLVDKDGDGFGDKGDEGECLCAPDFFTFHSASEGGDCQDLNTLVNPDALELCNAHDEDCDGQTDEGFEDSDGDGIADCVELDTDGDGVPATQDCNDDDPAIHQGAVESCNDVDDDCDGQTDEMNALGCAFWLLDADGDGQGSNLQAPLCLCAPSPETYYTAAEAGDCDDLDPKTWAGAPELCNGEDESCDGLIDEGYLDTDDDGKANCVDLDDDGDSFPDLIDCDPVNAKVSPVAFESCNQLDDDCDGLVDEQDAKGCVDVWRDLDGDGFGSEQDPVLCLCAPDPTSGYSVIVGGDCDDLDPGQKPGVAELCDGEDDDCDGLTDEGVSSPCGTCTSVCLVDVSAGGDSLFAPNATNAENVVITPEGWLTLASAPGDGHYRHVLLGWPDGPTSWDHVMVQMTGGQGVDSGVQIGWRVADTPEGLEAAAWNGPYGPFPPALFPLDLDAEGLLLELELTLNSAEAGLAPIVQGLTVEAHEVTP